MDTFGNKMIGIYGGSFDPIHFGHLRTALEIKEAFSLDELRLIPCYQSPLKNSTQATPEQRLAILQLAIEGEKSFICDNRELKRAGRSFMVETLASLRADFPEKTLILFMGSDAFAAIEQWHQWQKLFEFAHIVVMTRPNCEKIPLSDFLNPRLSVEKADLTREKNGKLFFQPVTQLAISATQIRNLLAQKRSIRFLLPDNVINYINRYALYRIKTPQE